jgi:hypothetical protein
MQHLRFDAWRRGGRLEGLKWNKRLSSSQAVHDRLRRAPAQQPVQGRLQGSGVLYGT